MPRLCLNKKKQDALERRILFHIIVNVFLLYKSLFAIDDVDAGNGDSLNLTACDLVDNLCSVLLNSILDVLNAGCATPVRVVALLYLHNQPIIYQFAAKYKKIYNITQPAGKILVQSVFLGVNVKFFWLNKAFLICFILKFAIPKRCARSASCLGCV